MLSIEATQEPAEIQSSVRSSNAEQASSVSAWSAKASAPERSEQRQTRQRDAILSVVQNSEGPLAVSQIHEKAKVELPTIGIATVYLNLKLLNALGQVQTVIMPSGETRYERTGIGHHEHFQCRACKRVFDLPICPVHIPRGTRLPGGFLVEDHTLTIFGLCSECEDAGL